MMCLQFKLCIIYIVPEVIAVVCHMTDPTTGVIFYSLITVIVNMQLRDTVC